MRTSTQAVHCRVPFRRLFLLRLRLVRIMLRLQPKSVLKCSEVPAFGRNRERRQRRRCQIGALPIPFVDIKPRKLGALQRLAGPAGPMAFLIVRSDLERRAFACQVHIGFNLTRALVDVHRVHRAFIALCLAGEMIYDIAHRSALNRLETP